MKIKDQSYYKKNTLNRYLISKELKKHRDFIKQEKAKKINDFIIPIFSATLTICSSYFLHVLNPGDILDSFFIFMLIIACGFLSVYFISVCLIRLYNNIKNFLKVRLVNPDKDDSDKDLANLLDYFNIDIINQVLLSYTLIKDSTEQEIEERLKNHYVFESFFYLKSSLDKMNEDILTMNNLPLIFTENKNNIEIYRIVLVFDMLRNTFKDIKESGFNKTSDFENDMKIAVSIFNRLSERLKGFVDIDTLDDID